MTRAVWNDHVVAESDDIVIVEGNAYFPRDALDERYFEDSSHHTICPSKGRAHHFDLVADGERTT